MNLTDPPSSTTRREAGGRSDNDGYESWIGKLKERLVWRSEFETLDQARTQIGDYIDRYHHRPHSGLSYRTPTDVRRTWEDGQRLQKTAA